VTEHSEVIGDKHEVECETWPKQVPVDIVGYSPGECRRTEIR